MPKVTFSLSGQNESPTKFVAKARNFEIVIDEPANLGGTDHGPNPVEYILAGYAGCLNVMGHLVAKEQGIELQKLEIELEGDLDPDKLFGKPTDQRAGYQEIRLKLKPQTTATQEQLDKWVEEVEARCPVNDNLANITPIKVAVEKTLGVSSN
ncbi:OsmC family protein [Marinilabilia rubra]|uniref:Osmotically inducible protein C n=1 Tax=Marinilabilia rubra TaxID=2162893 RepID=A0A2U2B731_9BACT|nr:OsmC family protein [Marinilabilia rubra]PWD98843.1 osmotically inducible protein C [Marinilabilia rubra]